MSSFRQLMMKKKGGGTKTLNLVSVGGATYDSDYIFTKTSADSMNMYFETPDTIFSSINSNTGNFDTVEMKLKIKFASNYNSPIGTDQSYSFGLYLNSSYRIGLVLSAYINSTYLISANQWYWLKITKNKSNNDHCYYSFFISENDVDYTTIEDNFDRNNVTNNTKLFFGKGTSSGTAYNFQGSIDFKECSIKINGEEVLWI